jgi:Cu+-exporting ATPase
MKQAHPPVPSVAEDVVSSEVLDPVCGMRIAPGDAVGRHVHEGTTYHFCSTKCLEDFEPTRRSSRGPAEVTATSSTSGSPDDAEYTCPMHPEVRQSGPGTCPKCGMALEPVTVTPPAARTEYTCPMHPEIVRDQPGSCPICGMALEPRVVTGKRGNPERWT